MHNTTGDVAVTNINEKQIISVRLCSIQEKSSLPFLSLEYVLSTFLNFGHFSASCSYKKRFLKKKSLFELSEKYKALPVPDVVGTKKEKSEFL